MGSNQDIHCLQGVACSSPVMPGLTRHPVDNGSPSGRLFVYWIPAFAGMTMGGRYERYFRYRLILKT